MEDKLKDFYIINKYEPLSLMFLSIFAFCITLQFVSMFIHRWGTFLHLMSSTRIDWFQNASTEEDFVRFVVSEAQRLQRMEPAPDYDELPPDYDDDSGTEEDEIGTLSTLNESEENYKQVPPLNPAHKGEPFQQSRRKSSKKSRHSSGITKNNDVPLLQQIFEDRLENIHRKWKQGSIAFRNNRPVGRFDRSDSHRFSSKLNELRQRMFKRSFKKNSDSSEGHDDHFNGVMVEAL
jgi:chitin synthase